MIDRTELDDIVKVFESISEEVKVLKIEMVVVITNNKIEVLSATPTELDGIKLEDLPLRVWKTSRNRIKGFTGYQRAFIRDRDNHKCQFPDCNRPGTQVHHIVGRGYAFNKLKWKLSEINDSTNGILLCSKCHQKIHKNFLWKSFIKLFRAIIAKNTGR